MSGVLRVKVALWGGIGLAVVCLWLVGPSGTDAQEALDQGRFFVPSVVSITGTLNFTQHVYLPVTYVTPPPLTETLKTRYLFVEYWMDQESGGDCGPSLCIDFPGYAFFPDTGTMWVYWENPELNAGDVGYVGNGRSLSGTNCGMASQLTTLEALPLVVDDVTLSTVERSGAVSLVYQDQVLRLRPHTRWISRTVAVRATVWGSCTVTTTRYIANYAFQDRNKIVYYTP